jgi:hypothetical protein
VFPHAVSTAMFSPLFFKLAQRMRQGGVPVRPPAEGTA